MYVVVRCIISMGLTSNFRNLPNLIIEEIANLMIVEIIFSVVVLSDLPDMAVKSVQVYTSILQQTRVS